MIVYVYNIMYIYIYHIYIYIYIYQLAFLCQQLAQGHTLLKISTLVLVPMASLSLIEHLLAQDAPQVYVHLYTHTCTYLLQKVNKRKTKEHIYIYIYIYIIYIYIEREREKIQLAYCLSPFRTCRERWIPQMWPSSLD